MIIFVTYNSEKYHYYKAGGTIFLLRMDDFGRAELELA